MVSSGVKYTAVPFGSKLSVCLCSLINSPLLNAAILLWPSLNACTLNWFDKALTAFVPTPFNPTDFWNALLSYFASETLMSTVLP